MKKIELNNISVSYITGDFSTTGLKDVIIQKLKRTYVRKEFLALQGITFSLEQGNCLELSAQTEQVNPLFAK